MTTPNEDALYRSEGWVKGVNNRLRQTEGMVGPDGTPAQFVREAVNVDLSLEGKPRRRKGSELVDAGFCHSLWRHPSLPFALMVREGQLCTVTGPEPLIEPVLSVSTLQPMSYAAVNHTVYFSNGTQKGCVDMLGAYMPWGLPVAPEPAVNAVVGYGLYPGQYQVCATYVDAAGVEGGASDVSTKTLSTNGGLEITIPAPMAGLTLRLYATEANGEIFYAIGDVVTAATTTVGIADIGRGKTLTTQHMESPIPGHIVRHYRGRLYIAVQNAVFFTEPLQYGLIQPAKSLYLYPTEVTLIEPVSDGIYVGHGSAVEFLQFTDPYEPVRTLVSSSAPVPGTGTQIPGGLFETEEDFLAAWWSQRGGLIIGRPGGKIEHMTESQVSVPKFGAGAIMSRENEGLTQLVTVLRQPGGEAAVARDSVIAEVRKINVNQ